MRRIGVALLAAWALLFLAGQDAAAQTLRAGWVNERTTVDYADLDLNSEAGVRILLSRIRQASERVCGLNDSGRELRRRNAARACIRESMDQTVARVEYPQVQAFYAASPRQFHVADDPTTIERTADGETRIVIRHTGFDLNSDGGRRAVNHRLERAARQACGVGWRMSRSERACMDRLMATGETQIAEIANRQLAANAPPAEASAAVASTGAGNIEAASSAALVAASTDTQLGHGVCAPRTVSAAFERGSASLNRAEHNAIAYAVDSASVCRLSSVVIAVNGADDISRRRAQALRAAMIRRGVPDRLILVEQGDGLEPEVRMSFSGIATADGEPAPAPVPVS